MEYTNIYETTDLYIAATLRTLSFPLIDIKKGKKENAIFIFSDRDKKASQIIMLFWDKNLKVSARTFVESINELKTRIYSI